MRWIIDVMYYRDGSKYAQADSFREDYEGSEALAYILSDTWANKRRPFMATGYTINVQSVIPLEEIDNDKEEGGPQQGESQEDA